jgi:hypothetical protein
MPDRNVRALRGRTLHPPEQLTEAHDKWRDIPGYEGRYQCTRSGLFRSLLRRKKLLKTSRHRDGYDKLKLSDAHGRKRTFHPHTLIALTFLGPRPAGHLIDHENINHADHQMNNLRYVTPSESNRNRHPRGEGPQSTGEPGVYHHGLGGYCVRLQKKRLGRYMTIDEAREVADKFRAAQRRAKECTNQEMP